MKKGLTITMIFEAESGNYGQSMGNIMTLKKMSRSDGNMYTYLSRQAMRYNIVQQMGADNTPVSRENGTVQFTPSAKIDQYPEIDLFGYMKTQSGAAARTRSAAVRLSNALSLEPYNSDLDFQTNMGLAKRGDANGEAINNDLPQSEIHRSMYSYTVSIDLDRIGEDTDISIAANEKADRVCSLLDTLQFLYRDIKGRRENLAPVFVIGGVYDRKSPYFEGRCRLVKGALDCGLLGQIISSCEDAKRNTVVGQVSGCFPNSAEIAEELSAVTVDAVFSRLKAEVRGFYD